ncbi:MAG: tetratricopeptide repeat protein, partial [Thermoanaerobaculia bacterium]|nr:tetratricopeptide repeat protein [Thermoanaerobaculia bacterium]
MPATPRALAGVLYRQGNFKEAETYFAKAVGLEPNNDVNNYNMALVKMSLQKPSDALPYIQKALQAKPDSAEYTFTLGQVSEMMGSKDGAIAAHIKATLLEPGYIKPRIELGRLYDESGQYDKALEQLLAANKVDSNSLEANNNLGSVYLHKELYSEAINHYRKAVSMKPNDSRMRFNLGLAFTGAKQWADARDAFIQVMKVDASYWDAYYNLGNALKDLDRYTDCVKVYQRAIELTPHHAEAHNNLGLVLYELGRLEEAIAVYKRAIELRNDYPDAHLNMALSLLAAGDLERGFQEYEWRWRVKGKNFKPMRSFPQPLWDGSDLTGKTILLHAEQGFGDTIQFIRYASWVKQRGDRVIVECQAALVRLLQTVAAIDQVIPAGSPLPEFDVHLPLLSLPDRFHTSLQNVPRQIPYLQPPESAPLQLTGSPKVGIVWAGSPDNANDRQRSCPFEAFADLLNVPGIAFFSLQKGERSIDLQAVSGVTDLSEDLRDFADTAGAIAQLDLVITVDTAVSHLAGALGKPVWVLLSFAPDWRWMRESVTAALRDRPDSPWYPTARLFRQPAPGDWASVISQAKNALKQWRSNWGSPQQSADLLKLGNALRRQGKLPEAIAAYRQSIALFPDPIAFNNLGVTLRQVGDQAGAIDCYQQALKLNSNYVDTRFNLGNALKDQDDLTGAIAQYRLAIALKPNQPNVWVNLGNTLKAQGKLAEAIDCYRQGVAIDPHHASAHNNLGQALLQAGDWREGFAENEWRWHVENYAWPRPPLPQPRWDGSDLTGKTILLYAEQGFGDTIQFIRYAPLVAAKGGRMIVECQPPLVRLLQTVAAIDRVIPRGEPLPEFDFQIPLLSLPNRFTTSIETTPTEIPYLQPPADSIALPKSTGLKVGIAWAGSPTNRGDRYRSCGIDRFLPLLEIPGITFYSLQKGAEVGDHRIINLDSQLGDFADTAGAIAQLDLVITVDTAVAHLAGALGKPVWVVLCFDADWRWMRDRPDSPWYPTARLFRQSVAVIGEVCLRR